MRRELLKNGQTPGCLVCICKSAFGFYFLLVIRWELSCWLVPVRFHLLTDLWDWHMHANLPLLLFCANQGSSLTAGKEKSNCFHKHRCLKAGNVPQWTVWPYINFKCMYFQNFFFLLCLGEGRVRTPVKFLLRLSLLSKLIFFCSGATGTRDEGTSSNGGTCSCDNCIRREFPSLCRFILTSFFFSCPRTGSEENSPQKDADAQK